MQPKVENSLADDVPADNGVPGMDALSQLQADQEQESAQVSAAVSQVNADQANAAAQAESEQAAARAGAAFCVGFLEQIIQVKAPYVVVPPEQKAQVVDKVAAVLVKYGAGLPEWLVPYREELELGIVLATASFGIYMQVSAHHAAEAAAEKQRKDEGQKQAEHDKGAVSHAVSPV